MPESVHAMEILPSIATPSEAIKHAMARATLAMGGDDEHSAQTLRLLRSNLGQEAGEIYAYSPRTGILCVIHWPRAGNCVTGTNPSRPGVALLFSPGGPGYPGQSTDLPAAVAGVVADNVTEVKLTDRGVTTPLRIMSNAFFAEIRRPALDEAWPMALTVEYASGSAAEIQIPDPRY
jgi:hypothetical protein